MDTPQVAPETQPEGTDNKEGMAHMKRQNGLWYFQGRPCPTLGAALRAAWPSRKG